MVRWCVPDYAVGALAQFLGDIVPLIDDELLVEDLEDLATGEVRHGGCSRGGMQRRGEGGGGTRKARWVKKKERLRRGGWSGRVGQLEKI